MKLSMIILSDIADRVQKSNITLTKKYNKDEIEELKKDIADKIYILHKIEEKKYEVK